MISLFFVRSQRERGRDAGRRPLATSVYGALKVPPKMSELPNVAGQSLFGAGLGSGVAVVSA
jgi:hypothetical protein